MPTPRLSDAYKSPALHYHHKKHLDFESVNELPEAYKWGQLDEVMHQKPSSPSSCTESATTPAVPVIDLEDPRAGDLIGEACRSWGAFQVINHGVPARLFDDVESEGTRLFSLPMQQKLKASREPDGVTGYGPARISSFFPKLLWSEGFTIFGSPVDHARRLWPQDYGRFCDVISQYENAMKQLASRLMWQILGYLNITNDDVSWTSSSSSASETTSSSPSFSGALQLNSYPTCPDPTKAMGLAAHTDSTILTILHQQIHTAGLQLHHENFGWVTVPPVQGGLVVNIGDLLHILSNGLYPSVLHRVVVNKNHRRLSFAYLHGPPMNARVSPVSKLVDDQHPPLYRSISWTEYLTAKAKYFNKALLSVRVCSTAPVAAMVDHQQIERQSTVEVN